jgi:hypothetical protein
LLIDIGAVAIESHDGGTCCAQAGVHSFTIDANQKGWRQPSCNGPWRSTQERE